MTQIHVLTWKEPKYTFLNWKRLKYTFFNLKGAQIHVLSWKGAQIHVFNLKTAQIHVLSWKGPKYNTYYSNWLCFRNLAIYSKIHWFLTDFWTGSLGRCCHRQELQCQPTGPYWNCFHQRLSIGLTSNLGSLYACSDLRKSLGKMQQIRSFLYGCVFALCKKAT